MNDKQHLKPEFIIAKSVAAGAVCTWIQALVRYAGLLNGQDVAIDFTTKEVVVVKTSSPKKKRPQTSPMKKKATKPKQQSEAPSTI